MAGIKAQTVNIELPIETFEQMRGFIKLLGQAMDAAAAKVAADEKMANVAAAHQEMSTPPEPEPAQPSPLDGLGQSLSQASDANLQ